MVRSAGKVDTQRDTGRLPARLGRKATLREALALRTPRNPRDQAVRNARLALDRYERVVPGHRWISCNGSSCVSNGCWHGTGCGAHRARVPRRLPVAQPRRCRTRPRQSTASPRPSLPSAMPANRSIPMPCGGNFSEYGGACRGVSRSRSGAVDRRRSIQTGDCRTFCCGGLERRASRLPALAVNLSASQAFFCRRD